MDKLLVAYDGSGSAQVALEFGVDLAKRYGAELHLLAVVHPPDIAGDVETEALLESSQRHSSVCWKTPRPRPRRQA